MPSYTERQRIARRSYTIFVHAKTIRMQLSLPAAASNYSRLSDWNLAESAWKDIQHISLQT
jgi:hypothetical protein